jgi:hypothetical protein
MGEKREEVVVVCEAGSEIVYIMGINRRYRLLLFFLISSFLSLYGQGNKKIVFPVTIVIYSGIDTIYCFEDSLSEKTVLMQLNSEEEFVKFMKHKLKSFEKIDTNMYNPIVRFYAVGLLGSDKGFNAWERVFIFDSKTERKGIEFWKKDDEGNKLLLAKIIRKRLEK